MSNGTERRLKRIEEWSRRSRKECENKTFRLVGVTNPFGIFPGFSLPVFVCEQDGKWYAEEGDDDKLTINSFYSIEPYSDLMKHVVLLDSIKRNEFTISALTIYSEPVFMFQISEAEYFIGYAKEMKEFLQDYKTEDSILEEDIKDIMRSFKEWF